MDPGNEHPTESPGVPVNLNDLQHYLVTFNKEIEQTDDPDQFTVGADGAGVAVAEALSDGQGDQSGFITVQAEKVESIDPADVENVVNVVDLKLPYGAAMDINEAVQQLSQVEATANVRVQTQPITNGQPEEVPVDLEDPSMDQAVSNCMAEVQAHMAEMAAQDQVTKLSNVEELAKTVDNKECFMKQLEIPVSESGDGEQKIVHVVSIDGQEHMQLVDAGAAGLTTGLTTGLNTSTGQLIHIPTVSTTLTDSIEQELADTVGNGSDPVAVLASVAANTSTLNQLQTITVGQTELNSAQLVALQNSSDSTQPQLVAVQAREGAMEIMGTEGNDSNPNSIVLNTGDNNFQTVTIVPSEMNPSGEMSYVLIVSQPDKEDSIGSPKQLSLDMGSVLDMKDETQEMVEEIVQEDGTTRRVITIVPKRIGLPIAHQAQLMCHYCDYTSPKRYLLMRHMKTHSEDRPHKCNICDRGFKTMASLQNHVNTHTGTRPHKCKECAAAFTTSGELVRHIRYKHTFEKPHKCTECDYASVELSKMKRHMRSHTGERPYHCSHCNYASPDTYKLKRHMRIHTGEKPYECDVCHARFTQSNSLKAHKLIHSGNKPVFQCHLCPTTCGRKTDLKIHMSKLHSSAKPLSCKKCGSTYPDRYTYKLHMKSHEGEKCFKCEQCDYAAQSIRHLESHILTHTGEKPFECKECGQTFRQKQLLRRHINLYHSPEYSPPEARDKMYECDECDKTFAHKGNLMRHMQQHDPDSVQYKDLAGQGRTRDSLSSPLTAEQLLQGSLLTEMREGKLGNTPKIVIVHPDGRVEEVTSKLQSLAHEKDVEDVLMGMTEDREQVEDGHPDSILQVTSGGTLDNQPLRISMATATVTNPDAESVLQDLQPQTDDERKDVETQVALETDSEHEEEVEQIFQQSGASAEDGNVDMLQIDLHTAVQGQEAAENVVISLQSAIDTRSKKKRDTNEDSSSTSKRMKIS